MSYSRELHFAYGRANSSPLQIISNSRARHRHTGRKVRLYYMPAGSISVIISKAVCHQKPGWT